MVVKAEKCCWTGFGVHPRAALASAMRTALKMAPPNLMSRVGPSPFVAAKQSVEDVLRCVVRGHQCESEEQGDEQKANCPIHEMFFTYVHPCSAQH